MGHKFNERWNNLLQFQSYWALNTKKKKTSDVKHFDRFIIVLCNVKYRFFRDPCQKTAKFYLKLKKTSYRKDMKTMCGDDCVFRTQVYDYFIRFKESIEKKSEVIVRKRKHHTVSKKGQSYGSERLGVFNYITPSTWSFTYT